MTLSGKRAGEGSRSMHTNVVLDTSIFTNPDTQSQFGAGVDGALAGFLGETRQRDITLYMPASVFRELRNFGSASAVAEFRRVAVVRGPDLYNLHVPAAIFHEFLRDLRDRVDKGLNIAEKAIRSENSEPDIIRWVRQHYRQALRHGIVDSVEDLEVVLLAKEVGGVILTADQGIVRMAESMGIEVYTAVDFKDRFFAPA